MTSRLLLGVLLSAGMVAGTFPIGVFSVLAPFLIAELELVRSQLGLLVAVHAGVGALLSPMAGRMADEWGGRTALMVTFVVASGALVAMALSSNYLWLLGATALAGLGNATCNPATNRLIVSHLRAGRQGLITGVKQSGVPAGFFLAGALLPVLALNVGWRVALGLAVFLPLLAAVLAMRLLPTDRAPHTPGPKTHSYRHPPVAWWLAAYGFLMGVGGAATTTYLPLFAHEAVGLSVASAGRLAATIGLVGVASRILWGRWTESRQSFWSPLALIAGCAVLAIGLIVMTEGSVMWPLWVAGAGIGATVVAWTVVATLAVMARTEERGTGRASGLVLFGFLAGYMISPPVFGVSVDRTGGYLWGWIGVMFAFGLAGLTMLVWGLQEQSERAELG